MPKPVSRRRFLTRVTAAGVGLTILPSRSALSYAANEKLDLALVGVGGRGRWFVDRIPRMENVVAVCDVNAAKLADAFRHWDEAGRQYAASPHEWERQAGAAFKRLLDNRPKTFRDFRKMLDETDRAIDAVVVATPDHSHAVVSAAAIRAGKGVFCEKPLTRTLHESRALRELAREHQVATAMGNQGTYSGALRRALELIQGGTLGEIKEVHVWNSGGGADRTEPPKAEEPVPESLDWDLWLGPARSRAYHRDWLRRHLWREFGTCQLGNWGSHTANLGFMALKVPELWLGKTTEGPQPTIRVEADVARINRLSFPRWETVRWQIPARVELPPITINWYNGAAPQVAGVLARVMAGATEQQAGGWRFAGTLIVGTKGSLHTTGHNMSFRLLPEEQFRDVQTNQPETLERSRGPEQDWLAACRGGKPAWSNFDYASALNEFLMLGNVATQFEETLEFDPAAMKIINHAEPDACLRCEYREGWRL